MTAAGSWLSLLAALGLGVGSACSAFDTTRSAAASPPPMCETADQQLSRLGELMADGRLAGLREVVSADLSPDQRTRLVAVLLDLVGTLPAGSLSGLQPLVDTDGFAAALAPISTLLSLIASDLDALAVVRQLLVDCRGAPFLATLSSSGGLLQDPEARAALDWLLTHGDAIQAFLEDLGLDPSTLQHRAGFQALVTVVLTAALRPGFSVDELMGPDGLLGLVIDPTDPLLVALRTLIAAVLRPGERYAATSELLQCVLAVDSDARLAGLLFDLLAGDLLTPLSELGGISLYPGGLGETLDRLVIPPLSRLATDSGARDAMVAVLGVLLAPQIVVRLMPDLITLIDEGLLVDLLKLGLALDTGSCQ